MAAAVGLGQLKRLPEFNERRRENARRLHDAISSIEGLAPPLAAGGVRHVFHQFTVRVKPAFTMSRDELRTHLEEKGIGSSVHYPLPIHRQPYYQGLGYRDSLPVAEEASREVLSLPVHPGVAQSELNFIIEVLRDAGRRS